MENINGKTILKTMDNGLIPFKVIIDGKKVSVFKSSNYDNDEQEYDKKVAEFKARKIFYPTKAESEYPGHSVLLELDSDNNGKYKYAYICEIVYTFYFDEQITKFLSYVGNSAVVYACAITKNFVIMFEDSKPTIVPKNMFSDDMEYIDSDDIYTFYYAFPKNKKGKKLKIKMIQKRLQ